MKLSKLLIFGVLAISILACRDTKKEQEKELEETVKQVESVERELDAAAEDLNKKAEEAEEALKVLDSI